MTKDVKNLGQVFTPDYIVDKMLKLKKNKGRVLEPSCGDGAFSNKIKDCVAIEYDKKVAPSNALIMDFFSYSIDEKFDTIIGNPPYVKYQDIKEDTKELLNKKMFDERTNLYMFFIHKCIEHLNDKGELIFIVPREFLKATSCKKLNKYIYEQGTITDFIELGDQPIFKGYSPNCVIFRFEKGNFKRKTNKTKTFSFNEGQLLFLDKDYSVNFNDLFFVKVGAVSGYDKAFINDNGNMEFVYSKTRSTNKTRRMFYNVQNETLLEYKDELLNRKLKKFNQSNWYMWGRGFYETDEERIYVNCKTRIENPFFTHSCKNYDGSVLAIFPKFKYKDINEIVEMLNKVDWEGLGFVCDGRFIFSQRSLENCLLPKEFKKFLK